MKISAVSVDSFKRIDHIEIAPDADKVLVLIAGRNGQGKSSLLDALTAAFGGKSAVPADPVRHGADAAEIRVELDGGALVVRRTIRGDGESLLEVRDAEGRVRSPQAVLDKLVGARFLDPLAFVNATPAEQRKALLAVIDQEGKIAALDARRARVFDRRTEVGRDHKKAAAELDRVPEVEIGDAIDVAALNAEVQAFAEQQRRGDGLGAAVKQAETEANQALSRRAAAARSIETLERQLAEVRTDLAKADEEATHASDRAAAHKEKLAESAKQWADGFVRRAQLDADLKRADEHNRTIYSAEGQAKRRAEVATEVEALTVRLAGLNGEIERIDGEKAAHLAAAALPVKGLDVDAGGIRFNGVPFAQASGAEQLRVALALAMAASPNLRDVWIRDGSLLDDESMTTLEREAAQAGCRCWVERVGDRDPGAIVIHDGRVRAIQAKAS